MRTTWMAVLTAVALAGVGFLALPAIADGDGDDDGSTERTGKGERLGAYAAERKAARDDARAEYLDTKREARATFHDDMARIRAAFQACKDAAKPDNATDNNATDNNATDNNATDNATGNVTDCRALIRDHLAAFRQDARLEHRLAKARAQAAYHDTLVDLRPDAFRERCAAQPACVERVIAHLQAQLARAENHSAYLDEKLDNATARYDNLSSDPNATARQLFHAKDLLYRLQIAVLKIERHIHHIENQLTYWQGVQDDPDDGDAQG